MDNSIDKTIRFLKNYYQTTGQNTLSQLGLVSGSIGLGLCYYYSWLHTHDSVFEEAFFKIGAGSINNNALSLSLGSGLASFLWFNSVCNESFPIPKKESELLLSSLRESMNRMLDSGNYSLFGGACGIGLAFLQQSVIPEEVIKQFVLKTEYLFDNGWDFSVNRNRNGQNESIVFIGPPHGLTGLLLFCLKIKEYTSINVDSLILKISRKLNDTNVVFQNQRHFPHSISKDGAFEKRGLSMVCWSFGDLMAAFALMKVGVLFDEQDYYHLGLSLLLSTIDREDNCYNLNDLGLCCGISAIPLVYEASYSLSKHSSFLKSSLVWKERVNSMFIDLIDQRKPLKDNRFIYSPSLYYGIPGPILVQFYLYGYLKDWASVLLL